jgi:hypothetical protein
MQEFHVCQHCVNLIAISPQPQRPGFCQDCLKPVEFHVNLQSMPTADLESRITRTNSATEVRKFHQNHKRNQVKKLI